MQIVIASQKKFCVSKKPAYKENSKNTWCGFGKGLDFFSYLTLDKIESREEIPILTSWQKCHCIWQKIWVFSFFFQIFQKQLSCDLGFA